MSTSTTGFIDLLKSYDTPASLHTLAHSITHLKRFHPDSIPHIVSLRCTDNDQSKAHSTFLLNLASQDTISITLILQNVFGGWHENSDFVENTCNTILGILEVAPSSGGILTTFLSSFFPHQVRPLEHHAVYVRNCLGLLRACHKFRWLQSFVIDLIICKAVYMDKDTTVPAQGTDNNNNASLSRNTFAEDSKKALAILLLLKEYIWSVPYDIQLCSSLLKAFQSHILDHHLEHPKHTLHLYHDICLKWSDFGNRLLGHLFSHLGDGNKKNIIALIAAFTAQVQSVDTKLVIDLLNQQKNAVDAIEYITCLRKHREKKSPTNITAGVFPLLNSLQEAALITTEHGVDKSLPSRN